jgi:hypothetical protein
MTDQLIREPAPDGLLEAAETVIAEAVIDGSGAASVPKGAMRKLAIAVNKAALAQPAPEPVELDRAADEILRRAYQPAPEPDASEPPIGPRPYETLGEVAPTDPQTVLSDAAKTFRFYEWSHRQKGTSEGDEKAERNRVMAERCEAAVVPPEPALTFRDRAMLAALTGVLANSSRRSGDAARYARLVADALCAEREAGK